MYLVVVVREAQKVGDLCFRSLSLSRGHNRSNLNKYHENFVSRPQRSPPLAVRTTFLTGKPRYPIVVHRLRVIHFMIIPNRSGGGRRPYASYMRLFSVFYFCHFFYHSFGRYARLSVSTDETARSGRSKRNNDFGRLWPRQGKKKNQ